MTSVASRDLIILRHAKSDWFSGASGDFDRPLNQRGAEDAPRMGRWLRSQDLKPDRIISSPALRAQLTTLAVAEQLGLGEEYIEWDKRVYMADVPGLMRVLGGCPGAAHRVMLVGHNPGLEHLVAFLAAPGSLPRTPYGFLKTATVAHLKLQANWDLLTGGSAVLVNLVTPKSLPA